MPICIEKIDFNEDGAVSYMFFNFLLQWTTIFTREKITFNYNYKIGKYDDANILTVNPVSKIKY